jgi:L-threonylcarbamoyladenylate synthase
MNARNDQPGASATRIRAPGADTYAEAAAIIQAGGLVAFPTETVYGLGADATDDTAVAGIFEAKGRPRFNPLIVHVTDARAAAGEAVFDSRARALAQKFWPGPLTLVLKRAPGCRISLLCSAGLETLALRVPNHAVGQALLEAAGVPLAAPSANRAGTLSPTTAGHVAESLGERVSLILDGGPCPLGLESTVLDVTGERPVILRPGGVTAEELERELGPLARAGVDTEITSPGMLASHYSPDLPLRLNAAGAGPDEALLAFGPEVPPGAGAAVNLSETGDLKQAAARLFAALHELDRPKDFTAIAVMPVPDEGLGAAINDRLRRAASPRGT